MTQPPFPLNANVIIECLTPPPHPTAPIYFLTKEHYEAIKRILDSKHLIFFLICELYPNKKGKEKTLTTD